MRPHLRIPGRIGRVTAVVGQGTGPQRALQEGSLRIRALVERRLVGGSPGFRAVGPKPRRRP